MQISTLQLITRQEAARGAARPEEGEKGRALITRNDVDSSARAFRRDNRLDTSAPFSETWRERSVTSERRQRRLRAAKNRAIIGDLSTTVPRNSSIIRTSRDGAVKEQGRACEEEHSLLRHLLFHFLSPRSLYRFISFAERAAKGRVICYKYVNLDSAINLRESIFNDLCSGHLVGTLPKQSTKPVILDCL